MNARIALLLAVALPGAGCATTSAPRAPAHRSGSAARHAAVATARVDPSASGRCQDLLPLIRQAASEAHLDPALLVGLVRTESNFRPEARSPVGAVGLTQVMPLTGRAKHCGDLTEPLENLRCGVRVLTAFLAWYKGDLYLSLSGYNAGHAMPDRAARNRALPANTDYVESVLWGRARFLRRGCEF